MKVRALKLIYTSDLKRIKPDTVFEIHEDDFSPHSMEKIESQEPTPVKRRRSKKKVEDERASDSEVI